MHLDTAVSAVVDTARSTFPNRTDRTVLGTSVSEGSNVETQPPQMRGRQFGSFLKDNPTD